MHPDVSGPLDQHQIHALTDAPSFTNSSGTSVRARFNEARLKLDIDHNAKRSSADPSGTFVRARRVLGRRENPEKWRADDNHGGTVDRFIRRLRLLIHHDGSFERPLFLDASDVEWYTRDAHRMTGCTRDLERRLGSAERGATSIADTSHEYWEINNRTGKSPTHRDDSRTTLLLDSVICYDTYWHAREIHPGRLNYRENRPRDRNSSSFVTCDVNWAACTKFGHVIAANLTRLSEQRV